MHLVNMPNIRVKEYPNGWIVEREFTTWYGKKYWKHIISVSGMSDEPWYFKTKEYAIDEAKLYFSWDLIYYSNN